MLLKSPRLYYTFGPISLYLINLGLNFFLHFDSLHWLCMLDGRLFLEKGIFIMDDNSIFTLAFPFLELRFGIIIIPWNLKISWRFSLHLFSLQFNFQVLSKFGFVFRHLAPEQHFGPVFFNLFNHFYTFSFIDELLVLSLFFALFFFNFNPNLWLI